MRIALAVLLLVITASTPLAAQNRPSFRAVRAMERPKIDGVLDDEVWKQDRMALGEWVSYNPLRGDLMPPRWHTDVRIGYDDRNIYFAFHCFDNEPGKIRTTISRRDSAFNDDWIALSLDATGTGQTAYHLFVNPSGIQMDALNTGASGEQFDADLIWYSAGKVTTDGYVVEIELPLQTLRFGSGTDVRMGILFFRKISRTGISYSWPDMPPGQWVFDRHAGLVFDTLKQRRLMEALPSVTYGRSQNRATVQQWDPSVDKAEFGMSGKFGITSNIVLDGTVNPDFSQVESDAFQVEVNQRFPVFYSEKRPFFMEGMGLFNLAGASGDGNMRTAVHTRRIVNPFWGSKLIGTVGRTTFGVLNAVDDTPDDAGPLVEEFAEHNKLFTIARATHAFRASDYIGAILTDTAQGDRRNTVAGADMSIKFSAPQELSVAFLASETDGSVSGAARGTASQVSYSYNTRRFSVATQVEHYGRDFVMDTAFYNRTGFTSGWSFGEINFYPRTGSDFWLRRVHPFYWAKRGYDEVQAGSEGVLMTGIRFDFTRQGFLNVSHGRGHEPWQGQRFESARSLNLFGDVQILRWLEVSASFNMGPEIYYDPIEPFQGESKGGHVGFSLQPNRHLNVNLDATRVRFDRESTGERVFGVDIVNLKATYQFNKHFLVRVLEQFDSGTHRLLTDALASYELVPGTVFHAGYGSLYERRADGFGTLVSPDLGESYLTVNRGLFLKASYLHRF